MKQIKVTFWVIDPDDRTMELWHTEPVNGRAEKYYGREVSGEKRWFELTDNFIMICPVSDDIEFIICDKEFNEIARDSNDTFNFPQRYPSLEERIRDVWKILKESHPGVTPNHWYNWIISFAPENMDSTAKSNWFDCQRTLLETEILHTFERLGHKYHIIRHKFKHTECEATWYEYFAADDHLIKSGPYIIFFGYQWEQNNPSDIKTDNREKRQIITLEKDQVIVLFSRQHLPEMTGQMLQGIFTSGEDLNYYLDDKVKLGKMTEQDRQELLTLKATMSNGIYYSIEIITMNPIS